MPSLKENLLTEFKIPEINGDRCVHAHIETATCEACVDACPEEAWILDDESLGLNTEACDGCGLCVPACSEGAILQTQICTIRETTEENNKQKVLLLGCEYTGLQETNCKCIHAVGTTDLLKLKRDGINHIYVATGDCIDCSRGQNETLFERIDAINEMLRHSHFSPIHYNEFSTSHWRELWKTPEKSAPGPEISRRMFFRSAIKQTIEMVMHQSNFDNSGEFIPAGKILTITEADEAAVYPAVPIINLDKCNGCDACMRACPHEVISLSKDNDQLCYTIDASACTACNICQDICDQDAVSVIHWGIQEYKTIPLVSQKCESCGVAFHKPQLLQIEMGEGRPKQRTLCNICCKTDHHRNLYQVMG